MSSERSTPAVASACSPNNAVRQREVARRKTLWQLLQSPEEGDVLRSEFVRASRRPVEYAMGSAGGRESRAHGSPQGHVRLALGSFHRAAMFRDDSVDHTLHRQHVVRQHFAKRAQAMCRLVSDG